MTETEREKDRQRDKDRQTQKIYNKKTFILKHPLLSDRQTDRD